MGERNSLFSRPKAPAPDPHGLPCHASGFRREPPENPPQKNYGRYIFIPGCMTNVIDMFVNPAGTIHCYGVIDLFNNANLRLAQVKAQRTLTAKSYSFSG
jgi:hypothetical protein